MVEFKKNVENIQKQNEDFKKENDSKLGELMSQIIESGQPVEKHVKLHKNPLTKTVFNRLQKVSD